VETEDLREGDSNLSPNRVKWAEHTLGEASRALLGRDEEVFSVLTLSPPLTVSRDDLDFALDVLDACLAEVGS
jgi:4-aminobutyrate aminotransferase-like enzyme